MPDLEAIIDLLTAPPAEGKPIPPATALGLIRAARLNLTGDTDPQAIAVLLDCPKGQADSILKWGEKLGLVKRGSTLTESGRARVTYRFTFPEAAPNFDVPLTSGDEVLPTKPGSVRAMRQQTGTGDDRADAAIDSLRSDAS